MRRHQNQSLPRSRPLGRPLAGRGALRHCHERREEGSEGGVMTWTFELRNDGFIGETKIPRLRYVFRNEEGVTIDGNDSRDSWNFNYAEDSFRLSFSAHQKPPKDGRYQWTPLALGPDCTVRIDPRSLAREIDQETKVRTWNTNSIFLD